MTQSSSQHSSKFDGAPALPVDPEGKPSMWRRILQLKGSSQSIALGTAIGLFVAMTPTVGLQMIIIAMISLVIPANRLAGFIMVYISNPLTVVPIYWFDYWLGLKCLGRKGLSRNDFEMLWAEAQNKAAEAGWYEGSLELMRSFGDDVLGPMFLGGTVVGLILGLPAYPLTLRFVNRYRAMKEDEAVAETGAVENSNKESKE